MTGRLVGCYYGRGGGVERDYRRVGDKVCSNNTAVATTHDNNAPLSFVSIRSSFLRCPRTFSNNVRRTTFTVITVRAALLCRRSSSSSSTWVGACTLNGGPGRQLFLVECLLQFRVLHQQAFHVTCPRLTKI